MGPGGPVSVALLVLDAAVKVIALGVVPEDRRPGSSSAWLLLILFIPAIGLPLFLLLGSPAVHGRRHRVQEAANEAIRGYTMQYPLVPEVLETIQPEFVSLLELNRGLTSIPCTTGTSRGLHNDYAESIRAITLAVGRAEQFVHIEIYILAMDTTTEPFFEAIEKAVQRNVTVRVLYDHLGSWRYPGHRGMNRRLTKAGVQWHRTMPIDPLRGQWRRPDLRNHRKLVVVDGEVGFMGSQNMIDASYLSRKNLRSGRRWVDLNIELGGDIVRALDAVFATDWYTETNERLPPYPRREQGSISADTTALQLVPSGPGFPAGPNLRLFTSLVHLAQRSATIVSPYFVPEESLLAAITTAAYRGVRVDLFVSEKADQFVVQHAQQSFYTQLLKAGVRIWQYPSPEVLHTKALIIDGQASVIGSSNMDMRSFELDYEISLFGIGSCYVRDLLEITDRYRAVSRELTLVDWADRPWYKHYIDNVMRLTSAVQ